MDAKSKAVNLAAHRIVCTPAWLDPNHESWLGLSARFGPFIRRAANRTDVVVTVSPDERHLLDPEQSRRPIACFVPALAEVRLTANRVLSPREVDPDRVDPSSGEDQARYPVMMGVMTHEAGHAAHTRLSIPKSTNREVSFWTTRLEEPRMEGKILRHRPQDRVWLRAAAMELVGKGAAGLTDDGPAQARSHAVSTGVLILGREHAGVFSPRDVVDVRAAVTAVLGQESTDELDRILAAAVTVDNGDTATLLSLGAQVVALLHPNQGDEETGEQQGSGSSGEQGSGSSGEQGSGSSGEQGSGSSGEGDEGEQGSGSSGEGDEGEQGSGSSGEGDEGEQGSGSSGEGEQAQGVQMPCGSWTDGDLPEGVEPWLAPEDPNIPPSQMTQAVKVDLSEIAGAAASQITAMAFPPMPQSRNHQQETKDKAASLSAAAAVFGADRAPIRVATRAPSPDLHLATRDMAAALRRARYRGQSKSLVSSELPPGRTRFGEVMRRESQVAAGARPTAKPFRQVRRRDVPQPPLRVGISGDVSGSMKPWQVVTADLTWMVAQSVYRLGGSAAAVAWNSDVAPTLHPRQSPALVHEAECRGATSACALSLRALDGALRLTADPTGARVVVVVTDGAIQHRQAANREIDRLALAGVKVLWVTGIEDGAVSPKAVNVVVDTPEDVGPTVSAALVELLAAV